MMDLPFSEAAFLDVFGAYNDALWPAVFALWIVTAGVVFGWAYWGGGRRSLLFLLATHWAWSGVVYHWLFFRSINPAATLFSGLFVVEAVLLVWAAIASPGRFQFGWSVRGVLAGMLIFYAMVYPLLGFATGLQFPRLPLFAVPCPTTLLTAGLLLASSGLPRWMAVIPALWAAIGASAAMALSIRADFGLAVAGVLLVVDTVAPRALGARPSLSPG